MWLDALMTSISPASHLLKMKLITVWNERMPDGGVVPALTTTTAVKYTNYSQFFGHLYFLKAKVILFTFGFEKSSNT